MEGEENTNRNWKLLVKLLIESDELIFKSNITAINGSTLNCLFNSSIKSSSASNGYKMIEIYTFKSKMIEHV